MKILITSFDAFAGRKTNLSRRAVERLRQRFDELVDRADEIVFERLPVAFHASERLITEFIAAIRPSTVLLVGEHRRARRFHLEQIALNVAHANLADNAGVRLHDQPLLSTGPLALRTSIDCRRMIDRLHRDGIPAALSHHGGTFVCNAAYFTALRCMPQSLFVHVPGACAPDRKDRGHVDRLADGLAIIIDELGRQESALSSRARTSSSSTAV